MGIFNVTELQKAKTEKNQLKSITQSYLSAVQTNTNKEINQGNKK